VDRSRAWLYERICRNRRSDTTSINPRPCAAIDERLTFEGTLIQAGTDPYQLKATENEYHCIRRL
jgi:hypothetical protein